jgi:hypothetical protein
MGSEHEMRDLHIEQLSKLLLVVQDVAHKLADESHGRAYDQVRELNEIVHLARLQVGAIEANTGSMLPAMERRRAARASFDPPR